MRRRGVPAASAPEPGTISRDVTIELPRPRDPSAPEFNRLKRELGQLVMEEQQRHNQAELLATTAD